MSEDGLRQCWIVNRWQRRQSGCDAERCVCRDMAKNRRRRRQCRDQVLVRDFTFAMIVGLLVGALRLVPLGVRPVLRTWTLRHGDLYSRDKNSSPQRCNVQREGERYRYCVAMSTDARWRGSGKRHTFYQEPKLSRRNFPNPRRLLRIIIA